MLSRVNLNRLAYFAAVVDCKSFTGAARSLGVAKAVVSHQVAQLEDELGVVLLERTTRRVALTEAGRLFEQRARDILAMADAAVRSVQEEPKEVSGTLRLGAVDGFCATVLRGPIARFLAAYPACRVEMLAGSQVPRLDEAGLDLLLRPGDPEAAPDGELVGSPHRMRVVISRRLLDGEEPRQPQDLTALPIIGSASPLAPLRWSFRREEEQVLLPVTPRLLVTSGTVLLAYLRAGLGCAMVPEYLVAEELAEGSLVTLLRDWETPQFGIYAAVPPGRTAPPRVAAFLALLARGN